MSSRWTFSSCIMLPTCYIHHYDKCVPKLNCNECCTLTAPRKGWPLPHSQRSFDSGPGCPAWHPAQMKVHTHTQKKIYTVYWYYTLCAQYTQKGTSTENTCKYIYIYIPCLFILFMFHELMSQIMSHGLSHPLLWGDKSLLNIGPQQYKAPCLLQPLQASAPRCRQASESLQFSLSPISISKQAIGTWYPTVCSFWIIFT